MGGVLKLQATIVRGDRGDKIEDHFGTICEASE